MKASVVLPVYNKAPFLRECLDSIFAQSFRDYELIAVDDASTDDSLQVLRSITDPRMRVIALDHNLGPGGAAQRGIDAANGEYILRVDADDVMLPGRFAGQVALLDSDRTIGACSGHLQLMNDPSILYRVELDDEDCKAGLLFGVPLNQPACAYRRSVLVEHGVRYRDEWPRYGEDWMHQVQLSRVTRFKNQDEALILYRRGPSNSSYGRDRNADLRFLYVHVFGELGYPITPDELDIHSYCVRFFPEPPGASHIRRYRNWLDKLVRLNDERRTFDRNAFKRRLDRIWDELYFPLPQYGWGPTWAYWWAGGKVSAKGLYYLIATIARGGLGERRTAR
ncbi:MAG TPA: glycosyltransferase family A protein [Flavobacteriales bacterium]|nr:glycosyltransferase family A protein [Flavobacteriales bacterium]